MTSGNFGQEAGAEKLWNAGRTSYETLFTVCVSTSLACVCVTVCDYSRCMKADDAWEWEIH